VEDSKKKRTIFIKITIKIDIIKMSTIAKAIRRVRGTKKLPSSSGLFLFLSSFLTKFLNSKRENGFI
jgi:hypothetical protein